MCASTDRFTNNWIVFGTGSCLLSTVWSTWKHTYAHTSFLRCRQEQCLIWLIHAVKKQKKKGNQRLLFLRKFLIFIIYNLPLSLKTEASVVNLSRCAPRLLVSPLVTFSIWNKCYGPFWTLSILWVANATSKVKVCSLSKLSFREWIHILTYSICYFLNKFLTFPSWDCRIPVSLGH